MCVAFHDCENSVVLGLRSMWPSMDEPNVLLVQLLQVRFRFAGNARPSACEPVNASCQFGVMPTPAIMLPRSVRAVCWLRLLPALCRSSTSLAITTPLAGPALVTKNVTLGACGICWALAVAPSATNAVAARMDTCNLVVMGSPPVLMQAVLTMQVSIYSFPYRPEHNTASRISLAIGSLATQLLERGSIARANLHPSLNLTAPRL